VNKRFPKQEKLKSRKTIDSLFSDRKTYTKYPLKVFYVPQKEINQAAFSVPKRTYKLAVDRNRIKRQMREAYRLNKSILHNNVDENYAMLFLYIGKDKPKYRTLEKAMVYVLKKLSGQKK